MQQTFTHKILTPEDLLLGFLDTNSKTIVYFHTFINEDEVEDDTIARATHGSIRGEVEDFIEAFTAKGLQFIELTEDTKVKFNFLLDS